MSTMLGAPGAPRPGTRPRGVVLQDGATYHWFYIWRLPLRITHWISGLSLLVLIVTGFYIGRPFAMASSELEGFVPMGLMRSLHFISAGTLVAMAILRVYWLFFGNRYERWSALVPTTKRGLRNTWTMLRAYVTVQPERAPHYLGHNPLQALSYTLFYVLATVEIMTGFAMYGLGNPGGFFYSVFGWIAPLLGGWQTVRWIHHLLLWAFVIFIPLHVYLVVRAAMLDRDGSLQSIFTGARYVREDVEFEDA